MSLTRALIALALVAAPAVAHAQFVDRTVVVPPPAEDAPPDDARPPRTASAEPPAKLEVRLTLSSFLYRELADDADPLVSGGAAPAGASSVRRFFGDLRGELTADRVGGGAVRVDGRVRAATLERYQGGEDEYELRALTYAHALGPAELRLGRQVIDALGATRVDGAQLTAPLSARLRLTTFAGAYPQRGSRSLTTDYPVIHAIDGSAAGRLVPVVGGAGVSYRKASYAADLGAVGVVASADVPGATAADGRRGFVTANGYARPHPAVDLYAHGVVDVIAAGGARVTEASGGVDLWPHPAIELSLTGHHVDNEVFAIAALNQLVDPDPAAMGQVENGTAIVRVAQDAARAAASVAVAAQRFQLTVGGGYLQRPAVTVPLTGGGALTMPGAQMGELTISALDRRAPGRLRVEASGTALTPLGEASASRSRGLIGRVAVERDGDDATFTIDASAHSYRDLGPAGGCMTLDPLACLGTSATRGVAAGALVSLSAGPEWLILVDARGGLDDTDATFGGAAVTWPRRYWLSAFARLQWRYR